MYKRQAVQPTRGLDVGAIEYIHGELVKQRDEGKAVLLVSLELDEVMNLSDRILVMYEGEIVGEFDPKTTTVQELGLYMACLLYTSAPSSSLCGAAGRCWFMPTGFIRKKALARPCRPVYISSQTASGAM